MNHETDYPFYRPLSLFISSEKRDSCLALDNDDATLEKERTRIQSALAKINETLRVVDTVEECDGSNSFVFNTLSRDFIDKIKEYFAKNESASRYSVSIDTHELPLDHLRNQSMRFQQETVIVNRRAFKHFPRPLPKTLFMYGVASTVSLYLFYLIGRILLKLFFVTQ